MLCDKGSVSVLFCFYFVSLNDFSTDKSGSRSSWIQRGMFTTDFTRKGRLLIMRILQYAAQVIYKDSSLIVITRALNVCLP